MRELFLVTTMLLLMCLPSVLLGGKKSWTGVDETVVEKFAAQAGRPAREPLINTDQGDLLLFVFAVAGAAGGFVAGYYFRALFGPGGNKAKEEKGV
jgi:ABC-type cobalt transport system substrate-binding protein